MANCGVGGPEPKLQALPISRIFVLIFVNFGLFPFLRSLGQFPKNFGAISTKLWAISKKFGPASSPKVLD